ncbi:MAG: cytochrome C biogenesis protein, partial [Ignavibacteriae bacterium]|nr:cytochrome C biogenesis protein [Ignavibacteriota bacterium]
RDVGLFYGSALLMASAIVIFIGTSSPIFGQSVEIEFYNKMNLPLVIIMSLLIGITLFLRWRSTTFLDFLKGISPAAIITLVLTITTLFIIDLNSVLLKLLLFSNIFVIVINLQFMLTVFRNGVRFLGGHISHIGIGIFLLGVLATSTFSTSQQVDLEKGVVQKVLDYEMTFTGINPIENGKKYEFNVDVNGFDESFTFSPIMYQSDFNNSIMREPFIFEGFLNDFYMSPSSYTEGNDNANNKSTTLSMQKGKKYEFNNSIIEFAGFNMPEDAMKSMTTGKEFKIGVKLNIVSGNENYYVEPLMKLTDGKKEYSTEIVKETGLKIRLTSLDVSGMVTINLTDQNEKPLLEETTPETFTAEVIIKPFMSLIWIGVIVVSFGMLLSIIRRIKESSIS